MIVKNLRQKVLFCCQFRNGNCTNNELKQKHKKGWKIESAKKKFRCQWKVHILEQQLYSTRAFHKR